MNSYNDAEYDRVCDENEELRARLAAAAHQNVCNMYAIESYVNGVEAVLGAQ